MLTGNKAGGQTQLCKENLPRQGENAASGRVGATGRRAGCCWKEGWVLLEGGVGAAPAHHNEGGTGACPQWRSSTR